MYDAGGHERSAKHAEEGSYGEIARPDLTEHDQERRETQHQIDLTA